MNLREAFEAFVILMKTHEEGVFFSHRTPEGKTQWHCGVGKAEKVDFDHPSFPFFCVTDFLGKECLGWKFEYRQSGDIRAEKFSYEARLPRAQRQRFSLKAKSQESKKSFMVKIKEIQDFQRSGNSWVLNLAHQFEGVLEPKAKSFDLAVEIFKQFLKQEKPHTGGFIWTQDLQAISLSPETFLHHHDRTLKTFPIKGTGEKQRLEESQKEQAELHMITDLLRNDLGQICKKVEVLQERVFTDQKTFHHSHSVIEGVMKEACLTWKKYQKLLPAGSVSGAPKKRVVEKILETESFQRDFYTGTFGVRLSEKESLFGILIRTIFFENQHWKLPVGAGITVDSDPKAEWEETLEKAKSCLDF